MEDIHALTDAVVGMLAPNGVFISESHYVLGLVETLQYDTVYHEHLRYYSIESLQYLLNMHGLEVFHVRRSRRTAARSGSTRPPRAPSRSSRRRAGARRRAGGRPGHGPARGVPPAVVASKLGIYETVAKLKQGGARIYGIGAPSRASTLINYVGLDDGILDYVLEVSSSRKLDKYIPGTLIPVVDEQRLYEDQPEYAMLLSWHIADELMPKITANGFRGGYLIPLPTPRVVPAGQA